MNVTIRGNNIPVNDSVREYAEKKVGKLDRYLPNISEIRVDLSRQNSNRGEDMASAQITLRHARGAILRVEEKVQGDSHDAFQAAISSAVDKMYRRIDRFKGKRIKNKRGREKYTMTAEELTLAEEMPEFEDVAQDYADDFVDNIEIVRRKEVALLPMSETEAIDQMELLGHTFFMFLNAETGQINVLYRRASDGYGVLIPNK